MTNVGILGLDTSHGEAFADLVEQLDDDDVPSPTVAAIWDARTVRDDSYVQQTCERVGAIEYDDPEEMIDDVDAVLILTVDWERHLSLARPFLEAGVPTLVDKPIAGKLAEITALETAAGQTPLFGGSAVPYHPSVSPLIGSTPGRTLHVAGYNDQFYYRAHVVDTVRTLIGADWTTVCPVEDTCSSTVAVSFVDGTWATLRFDGTTEEPAFGVLDVADSTQVTRLDISPTTLEEMYKPYLRRFLGIVRGDTGSPRDSVLNAARLLLAAEAALDLGRSITPDDPALERIDRRSETLRRGYEPYY